MLPPREFLSPRTLARVTTAPFCNWNAINQTALQTKAPHPQPLTLHNHLKRTIMVRA